MKSVRIAALISMTILGAGCKKPVSNSEVKWGATKNYYRDGAVQQADLLSLPPGGSIIIYEGSPDKYDFTPLNEDNRKYLRTQVLEGVKSWLGLLQRPIVVHESQNDKPDSKSVNIFLMWDVDRESRIKFSTRYEKSGILVLGIATPPRIYCSDWDENRPIIAYYKTFAEGRSASVNFCPRFFNLPTEPDNLETFQKKDGIYQLPKEVEEQASLAMNKDPFFKRTKEEIQKSIEAERRRHFGMPIETEKLWRDDILHELGHGMGLCDQYGESGEKVIDHGENCAKAYRSIRAGYSVMNGASKLNVNTPTSDDAMGVRVLSCLKVPAANKAWLAEKPAWFNNIIKAEVARIAKDGNKDDFLPECFPN